MSIPATPAGKSLRPAAVAAYPLKGTVQLCDRLVVMDRARVAAEGSPTELIRRFSTREVLELRFPPGGTDRLDGQLGDLADRIEVLPDRVLLYTDDGDRAAADLGARGLTPASTLVRRSSLEDVFLRRCRA